MKTKSAVLQAKTSKRKTSTQKWMGVRGYVASEAQIAATFTEWDRRFRENPEEFESLAVSLLKGTPKTYGEACAPYFIKLLQEVQGR